MIEVWIKIWYFYRAVNRDPQYFPDPENFNPQRWLTPEGKLRDDMKAYPFGFGRRICPGQHIAVA
jgi:cytochrome P450